MKNILTFIIRQGILDNRGASETPVSGRRPGRLQYFYNVPLCLSGTSYKYLAGIRRKKSNEQPTNKQIKQTQFCGLILHRNNQDTAAAPGAITYR